MDPRLAERRCSEQAAEPQSLRAEIVADQVIALVRCIALVEHEIDDVEHAIEPLLQFRAGGELEGEAALPNEPLRPDQPLCDGRFVGKKGPGDFSAR